MSLENRNNRAGLVFIVAASVWLTSNTPISAQEFQARSTLQTKKPTNGVMALSPNGKTLAIGSTDKTVILWDVAAGKELPIVLHQPGQILALAFSPDSKMLATSSAGTKAVDLWDLQTGKNVGTFGEHRSPISSIAFSPNGQSLAAADVTGEIKLWKVPPSKQFIYLSTPELRISSGYRPWVVFSPNGRMLVSCRDGTVLWELATLKKRATVYGLYAAKPLVFSPDGKLLASVGRSSIELRDIYSGTPLAVLRGHGGFVSSLCFSPDGKTLASGSKDKTIRLWNVGNATSFGVLTGHTTGVDSLAFTPDGKTLFSAGVESVKAWDNPVTVFEPEITGLIANLGHQNRRIQAKARKRLTEIGVPALDMLREVAEKGPPGIRQQAEELVKTIRDANLPAVTVVSQPVVVNGLEFTVCVNNEWTIPKEGETTDVDAYLRIRNTKTGVVRLSLSNALKVSLRDSGKNEVVTFGGVQHLVFVDDSTLGKDQDYAHTFFGSLDHSQSFFCSDYSSRSWQSRPLSAGEYQLSIVYESNKNALDGGAPYWVGKATTEPVTVVIK